MRNPGSMHKAGVKAAAWRDAGAGLAWTAAAVGLASVATGLARGDLAMIFLVAVLGAGTLSGLAAGLTAAATGALAYDLLFLEPRFTLRILRAGDALTFAVFFLAAVLTGWLSARARGAARRAEQRTREVERLSSFSRRLASAGGVGEVARALVREAGLATGGPAVLLTGGGGDDYLQVADAEPSSAALDDEVVLRARAAADGREAVDVGGWRLRPLPGRRAGVLATRPAPGAEALVSAVVEQGGVALDRAALARESADGEALRRTDRLRAALLNSVSHDLRTPLTGILGSATTLLDYGEVLPASERRDLAESVRDAADRLARYVGGLLELAQLEAGALHARHEELFLRELVDEARRRSAPAAGARGIEVDDDTSGVSVMGDAALLTQALVNLLDNAVRHGRAATPVRVLIDHDDGGARVLVEDDGPGVPPSLRARLFQPFAGEGRAGGGAGLGLSIARGFVEAMGGELRVESPASEGRGARFVIRLPLAAEATRA